MSLEKNLRMCVCLLKTMNEQRFWLKSKVKTLPSTLLIYLKKK